MWEDKCGVRGACWIYDRFDFSIKTVVFFLALKIISITFNVLALVFYKPSSEDADAPADDSVNLEKDNNDSINQM